MKFLSEKLERLSQMKQWQIILLLLILAFSLRAGRVLLAGRICKDGVLYVYMIRNLNDGDRSNDFIENRRIPPLYLQMSAYMKSAGIDAETAARAISLIAGSLLLIPFFLTAHSLFDRKTAVIASLLIAVHPDLVRISAVIMRDSLFLSLVVFAVYFVVAGISKKNKLFWIFAGIAASLASATRSEGVEILIAVLIWMAVDIIIRIKKKTSLREVWQKNISGVLLLLLSFSITAYIMVSSVANTASHWSIPDERFIGYCKSVFTHSSDEIMKKEDTL